MHETQAGPGDDNNNASVDKRSVGPAKLVVDHKGQQLV